MEQVEVPRATPSMKSSEASRSEGAQPHPALRRGLQSLIAIKCIVRGSCLLWLCRVVLVSLQSLLQPCLCSRPQQLPAATNSAVELNAARRRTSSPQVWISCPVNPGVGSGTVSAAPF